MNYLIFGAGGFVGKNLAAYLSAKRHKVYVVQRKEGNGFSVDVTSQVSFQVLNKINDVDIIINCASVLPDGKKGVNDADYLKLLFDTNVIGGINILNFAASKNIKRVLNCSTLSVVNKPWPVPLDEKSVAYPAGIHAGYCVSKLAQELLMNEAVKKAGIELLHLRLSSLYGWGMKWDGILPFLIEKAERGEKISVTNGKKVSFDFLQINDLVKIIEIISQLPDWPDKVLNTASGEEIFLSDLAQQVVQATCSSSQIEDISSDGVLSRAVIDTALLKKYVSNSISMTPLQKGIKELVAKRSRVYS